MTDQKTFLSTKEFSSLAGIPASSVTKMLREGKLKGEKSAGKWMIPASQLPSENMEGGEIPAAEKTYAIEDFAAMTYLTARGVAQWLKKGLLEGRVDQEGNLRVSEKSLEMPNIRRLIRET
jgi:hypothetical protein